MEAHRVWVHYNGMAVIVVIVVNVGVVAGVIVVVVDVGSVAVVEVDDEDRR